MTRIPDARPAPVATYLQPVAIAASWLGLVALATAVFFAPRGRGPTHAGRRGRLRLLDGHRRSRGGDRGVRDRRSEVVGRPARPLRPARGRDRGVAPPLFPLVRPDLRSHADGPLVVPSASACRAALGGATRRIPRAAGGCGGHRARHDRRAADPVRAATAAAGDGHGPRHPVRVRLGVRSAIRPRPGDMGRAGDFATISCPGASPTIRSRSRG